VVLDGAMEERHNGDKDEGGNIEDMRFQRDPSK
jgi:hypothetical protein